MKLIAIIAVLTSMFSLSVKAGCMNEPRTEEYSGGVIDVYVPLVPDITRIMLPERDIKGLQASNTDGIVFDRPNQRRIPNQIVISSEKENYEGLIMIDGDSGESYTFNIISKPTDCDSQVKVVKPNMDKGGNGKATSNVNATQNKGKGNVKRSLIYYMYNEKVPRGFRVTKFDAKEKDRFVLQQGSVKFYAEKQYKSRKLIGTTFKVVNEGREAFRVDINSINYSNKKIVEAFGEVEMVGMAPFDFILGPAPEKVSDLYTGPKNYGYLFVVSKK